MDWISLIKNDDNYKNKLQVKVQKEFKITPDYIEIEYDAELGYRMGVFICIGQSIHNLDSSTAMKWEDFGSFQSIQNYVESNDSVFVFLAESQHKIKKKAEQEACEKALLLIN